MVQVGQRELADAKVPVRVADPGDLNEIDLAAPDTPQSTGKSWLGGLLAILGGALAVFSAVRYLVA